MDGNLNAWKLDISIRLEFVDTFTNGEKIFKYVGQPLSSNNCNVLLPDVAIKSPAQMSYGPSQTLNNSNHYLVGTFYTNLPSPGVISITICNSCPISVSLTGCFVL